MSINNKKISPFGPAVWLARGNIYKNVLFYYMDYMYIYITYSKKGFKTYVL